MKVALVHTRLLQRGGLESRMFSYLRFFQERGDEVTVIVSKVGPEVKLPDGVRLLLIRLSSTPKWLRAVRFNARLGPIVKRENFDLVLSMGRTTHHTAMVVAGVHAAFLRARGKWWRGPSDWLQHWMDARAYASPGVLLAASEMVREQMLRYHQVNPGKVRVLYPPTDPARFHWGHRANRDALRERFGMVPGRKCFLLISANHRLKGLPLLLDVFGHLTDLPIDLMVAGPEPVNSTLPNVHYLGYVPDTESLYAAADFTLLPSQYDAFGQVVSESLLCGTPVIVSHMTGASAIVSQNEGLVVDSFRREDWENAIRWALNAGFKIDPDLAATKGLRFSDHMSQLLEWAMQGRS